MVGILDTLSLFSWAIAYCVIIYIEIKYGYEKKIMIPFAACCMNLAWEAVAFVQSCFWGHALWLFPDIIIFLINIRLIYHKSKKPFWHVFLLVGITLTFVFVFWMASGTTFGLLRASFIINLLMSIMFISCTKLISIRGKVLVATLKLFGTLVATLGYMSQLVMVAILGWTIFALDVFYLAICLEERSRRNRR